MTEAGDLRANGPRVWVAPASDGDVDAYVRATRQSAHRLREWNPVDPYGLPALVRAASPYHRTFLVHAHRPEGDHDLVGKVNVTNVVRGRAMTGTLGYDAFDPYAGRGLFREGLRLVVGLAFAPQRQGLGLHRLEVDVQPGNVRSAAVLRRLGFRREGYSPAYLHMPTLTGPDEWCDHDRYAVTADEWPAQPWAPARVRRVVVLVVGGPSGGRRAIGQALAAELHVPLLTERSLDALPDCVVGAVVEVSKGAPLEAVVGNALEASGVDVTTVPTVYADDVRVLDARTVVELALRVRAAGA